MADPSRPIKLLIKWVAVPVVVGALGYYAVGPWVSSYAPKTSQRANAALAMLNQKVHAIVSKSDASNPATKPTTKPKPGIKAKPSNDTESSDDQSAAVTGSSNPSARTVDDNGSNGGPEVEVSVRNAGRQSRDTGASGDETVPDKPKPKPHRRHHKPKPKPKVDPEMNDGGSYSGAQDQSGATQTGRSDPPTGNI